VSPDAAWAFHIYSRFDTPQRIELVRLPAHSVARVVLDNAEVSAKLERIRRKPPEFFRVDVGNGVQLDGWMIKPPDFDQSKRYPVLFFV
jgi:dipeptidyl-peptidase-4